MHTLRRRGCRVAGWRGILGLGPALGAGGCAATCEDLEAADVRVVLPGGDVDEKPTGLLEVLLSGGLGAAARHAGDGGVDNVGVGVNSEGDMGLVDFVEGFGRLIQRVSE